MLNIFKKKKAFTLSSPADGQMISIEKVQDDAFSTKSMGDGFAIQYTGKKIVSPVDGVIAVCFPTGHAIGIKSQDKDILIHIGIDTVELNGEGFDVKVKPEMSVHKGDTLVEVDAEFLLEKGYDPTTMVIITTGEQIECLKENQSVNCGEEVAILTK